MTYDLIAEVIFTMHKQHVVWILHFCTWFQKSAISFFTGFNVVFEEHTVIVTNEINLLDFKGYA